MKETARPMKFRQNESYSSSNNTVIFCSHRVKSLGQDFMVAGFDWMVVCSVSISFWRDILLLGSNLNDLKESCNE